MESSDYVSQKDPESLNPLLVHVTAPCDLQGGYQFEAILGDGTPFMCQVPQGGVKEGGTFWVPLPQDAGRNRIIAPTGKWKDGLFDCFSLGICHAHLLCAFCCSRIAMAQIMTRLHLTWLGLPGPVIATKNTFNVVVTLVIAYSIYASSLSLAAMGYSAVEVPGIIVFLKTVGGLLFGAWSIYSLCRTRQSVRRQYSIPEEGCHGYEDLCLSIFCTCCTLAQMARHTGEYETYPGVCCSKTGHPKGTPFTV